MRLNGLPSLYSRIFLCNIVIKLPETSIAMASHFAAIPSIALGYGLDGRGFESLQVLEIFLFITVSRPVLEPTFPPIQWVPEALSLGVKRTECGAEHSSPSSAEVKNVWRYTSTPQYTSMVWCAVKAQGQLYLYRSPLFSLGTLCPQL
jgi:hypothetical protein